MLELRLIEFKNPLGHLANGKCCDTWWTKCVKNGCDPQFYGCVSDYDTINDRDTDCNIVPEFETKEYTDMDSVIFEKGDQGTFMKSPEVDRRWKVKMH